MIARLRLAKVPLCLFIGCSTLFGAILANPSSSRATLLAVVSVFLAAAGAASLNSLQEHDLDGKMERTRNRPLPSRMITPQQAGVQGGVLVICGILLLAVNGMVVQAVLTGAAVVLYNGVYTPLKKKSLWAIVPGALCGAMPSYIGWLAGGGEYVSFPASLLFALFILWQVPHFWLILLQYPNDCRKAAFPSLLSVLTEERLKRLFVSWIGALACVMLLFGILPFAMSSSIRMMIFLNAVCLLLLFGRWLYCCEELKTGQLFLALNGFLLLHMLLLVVGRLIGQAEY